jgi:hypothetical protein
MNDDKMNKLAQINELSYQTDELLRGGCRFLKVRTRSGILKNLLDDKSSQRPTYPGKAEGRSLFLRLKPLGVYIGKKSESPETKAYQSQSYESSHRHEAGTLVISEAKVLFQISDAQFQGKSHGIYLDYLNGRESQVGGEQDDVIFFGLDHHYPNLLGRDTCYPQISGNYMKSLSFAIDDRSDFLHRKKFEQFCYFPFFALSGFGAFLAPFLLARWQRRLWFRVVPTNRIGTHSSDHMNGQGEHPVDERSLGKVGICYYSKRKATKPLMKLGQERTDSIPKGHGLSYSFWVYDKPKGIALARNKVGQKWPAKEKHLPSQHSGTEQACYGPVMPDEMIPSVCISTVIVPSLHSDHFPFDLGNQSGVYPGKISAIDQEILSHLLPYQGQDSALDLPHIPLVLGQKTLPTGDMSLQEKTDSGNIGYTFAALPKKHEGQNEPLKVQKIVRRKKWSKKPYVGDDSNGEECIHSFFSS